MTFLWIGNRINRCKNCKHLTGVISDCGLDRFIACLEIGKLIQLLLLPRPRPPPSLSLFLSLFHSLSLALSHSLPFILFRSSSLSFNAGKICFLNYFVSCNFIVNWFSFTNTKTLDSLLRMKWLLLNKSHKRSQVIICFNTH